MGSATGPEASPATDPIPAQGTSLTSLTVLNDRAMSPQNMISRGKVNGEELKVENIALNPVLQEALTRLAPPAYPCLLQSVQPTVSK